MATSDPINKSLEEILQEIKKGKIQLPNFQRSWVWDDDHIRDLLVSVGRSFPIGAVMLLEVGGEIHFEARPIEGVEDKVPTDKSPEALILDGQQRLTTLTQAIALEQPVHTRTSRGKEIKRHYYFDIKRALEAPYALGEALIAVDENHKRYDDFRKKVELNLSTTEMECEKLYFPCSKIMNSDDWEFVLNRVAPDQIETYFAFRRRVLKPIRDYQIPVIRLKKETPKEAVCVIFEKVNTGGVHLTVFELLTAIYAARNYNLRNDWYGSKNHKNDSRKERLGKKVPQLGDIESTVFLQGISILYTHSLRLADKGAGKAGKQVRPVGAKRSDILSLPLEAWKRWADSLEAGFEKAAAFLRKQGFYDARELPYRTQFVPLAAVLTFLGEQRWREPLIYDKLVRWFWSGVLGELYGRTPETRMANDYEDLLIWIEGGDLPRTVSEAYFHAERFDTLRTRQSAAYKGINVLVLRGGAKDWIWKSTVKELDEDGIPLDIHHIFPVAWCKNQKPSVPPERYQSILNKTMISYKANRKLGGKAPSKYLPRIQAENELDDERMNQLLKSHCLSSSLLRQDAYDDFIEDRRDRLSQLIETAMGKPVILVGAAEHGGEN